MRIRSLRLGLAAISLPITSLLVSTVAESSAGAASLRTFCIDYQDYSTFNPTSISEWRLELSSIKTLEHEAPASMKSPLRSLQNLVQTLIKQGGTLNKGQRATAKSLTKTLTSDEGAICSKYSGDG